MLRFSVAVLALLSAATLNAQPSRFGTTIEVKLIEIDVVVTDRQGNRVSGLTAADFEVYEGRKRQEITNFTEYRPAAAALSAETPAQVTEPRTILLMVDALPRDGMLRSRVMGSLTRLLPALLRQGDRISIVEWDTFLNRGRPLLPLTADYVAVRRALAEIGGATAVETTETHARGAELLAAAAREASARGEATDAAVIAETRGRAAGEEQLAALRRKTAAMQRLITSAAAPTGRKAFLYVSHDFALPADPAARLAAVNLLDAVARTANAAGFSFYAVRPDVAMLHPDAANSLLPERSSPEAELDRHLDALSRLTEPTGGLLDFGMASVETLGSRLREDLEAYYSIAYRARSDGTDRERRIRVRPKNPAYRVRTRRTVVEKSSETAARDTLLAHLFSGVGGGDLRFDVLQGVPRRNGPTRWLLPVSLRIPTDQLHFRTDARGDVAIVKVMIVAGNTYADATKITSDSLRIVRPRAGTESQFVTYSVELMVDRKGSHVSFGIYDAGSGLVGVRTIDTRDRVR